MDSLSTFGRRRKIFGDSTTFRIRRREPVAPAVRRVFDLAIDGEEEVTIFEFADGHSCSCKQLACRHLAALRRLGIRLRRETLFATNKEMARE